MLSFLSGASRKSYFMTSWPDESLPDGSVTTLPAAPPTSQTQPGAAAKEQTSTAQPLVYCGKYVTVPQRAAVKSAQGTSKYPLGVPHELSLSSKAGPGHYRLPTNRINREETTLCSQGRHWPPHSLVIANQDHHFPMKLVHPTHRLPRGLLLQSGSLPQLQTSVASAESTFRLL